MLPSKGGEELDIARTAGSASESTISSETSSARLPAMFLITTATGFKTYGSDLVCSIMRLTLFRDDTLQFWHSL